MHDAAIAAIVAELERLMDDARDRSTLPKHATDRIAGWRGREIGYREALRLLADARLARR